MEIVMLFGAAFLLAIFQGILSLRRLLQSKIQLPSEIAIVGVRDEIFAVTRAALRQVFGGAATLLKGYQTHGQHGRPFVIYDAGAQPELLLPVQDLNWFADQPESKLSMDGVRDERHGIRYLRQNVEPTTFTPFRDRVFGDQLRRHLVDVHKPLRDELQHSIETALGTDTETWRELNVYAFAEELVTAGVVRVFVGSPWPRDQRLRQALHGYFQVCGIGMIFIGQLPRLLRSLAAAVINIPLWYYRHRTIAVLAPVVAREMGPQPQSTKGLSEEPNFLRACGKASEKSVAGGVQEASNPRVLAEWIMSMGFPAVSSTILQVTNMLLDLATCPPEMEVWSELRREAEATLPDDAAWTQPGSFKQQVLADSAIRETLRCHPILVKGLTKEVVAADGLQLPNGTLMPKGAWIGVAVCGIHQDERYYPQPDAYDPWRFAALQSSSDGRQEAAAGPPSDPLRAEGVDAVKPSPIFHGFGYGRHACPGRWFAVLMLKMMLSIIAMHYDVQSTGPIPPARTIGDAAVPPMSATLRFRRRKTAGRATR